MLLHRHERTNLHAKHEPRSTDKVRAEKANQPSRTSRSCQSSGDERATTAVPVAGCEPLEYRHDVTDVPHLIAVSLRSRLKGSQLRKRCQPAPRSYLGQLPPALFLVVRSTYRKDSSPMSDREHRSSHTCYSPRDIRHIQGKRSVLLCSNAFPVLRNAVPSLLGG